MKKHRQDQMTLDEAIDALRKMPADQTIIFDFGRFVPQGLWSYRGYYEDLAIGYAQVDYDATPKVGAILEMLEGAIGKDFEGWKGGTFTMGINTPLWVSTERGDAGSTVVLGIKEGDIEVVIVTGHADIEP